MDTVFNNEYVNIQYVGNSMQIEPSDSMVSMVLNVSNDYLTITSKDRDMMVEICDRLGMPEPENVKYEDLDIYVSSAKSFQNGHEIDYEDLDKARDIALDVAMGQERDEEKAIRNVIMIAAGTPYIEGGLFDGQDHSDVDVQLNYYEEDVSINDFVDKFTEVANDLDYSQEMREAATALLLTTHAEHEFTTEWFEDEWGDEEEIDERTYYFNPSEALNRMNEARDLIASGDVEKISVPQHELFQNITYGHVNGRNVIVDKDVYLNTTAERPVYINEITDKQKEQVREYIGNTLDKDKQTPYWKEVALDNHLAVWGVMAGHDIKTNSDFKNYSDADRDVMQGKMAEESRIRDNTKEIGKGFYIAEGKAPRNMPFSGQEFSMGISTFNANGQRIGFTIDRDIKYAPAIDRAFSGDKHFSSFRSGDVGKLSITTSKENFGLFVNKVKDLSQEIEKNYERVKDFKTYQEREQEREYVVPRDKNDSPYLVPKEFAEEKEISIGGR